MKAVGSPGRLHRFIYISWVFVELHSVRERHTGLRSHREFQLVGLLRFCQALRRVLGLLCGCLLKRHALLL